MNWEKKPYGYTGYAGAWRFDICVGDLIPPHGFGILLVPPDTISTWDRRSTQQSDYNAPSVKLDFAPDTLEYAMEICARYAREYLGWED